MAMSMSGSGHSASGFHRVAIERIEDLSDAVHDANLQATQMSTGPMSGSLIFAEEAGIVCSSGLLHGRVSLRGPLSTDMITLGAGLRFNPGSWQWLTEAETGGVGIYNAADEHDSLHAPGAMYAAVTLSAERLEMEAAKRDLVLDRHVLGGSGVHPRKLEWHDLHRLVRKFDHIHAGRFHGRGAATDLLAVLIEHLGRPPIDHPKPTRTDRKKGA